MSRLALRRIIFVTALGAVLAFPQLGAPGNPAGTTHLPDLIALKPYDLSLQTVGGGRGSPPQKRIRLGFKSANIGNGPLQLTSVNNPSTGETDAFQDIFTHNATNQFSVQSTQPVGTFIFHPAHNHWHLDNYAKYELVQDNNGVPGGTLKTGVKVSFCIIETFTYSAAVPHFQAGGNYNSCGANAIYGLSPGMGDEYHSGLAGQHVVINNIPNGIYWLRATADPSDQIDEENETNNSAQVRIQITFSRRGGTVTIIG